MLREPAVIKTDQRLGLCRFYNQKTHRMAMQGLLILLVALPPITGRSYADSVDHQPAGIGSDHDSLDGGNSSLHSARAMDGVGKPQSRQDLACSNAGQQEWAIRVFRTVLLNDMESPVLGNPDGDISIVEFLDYRCPNCRQMAEILRELVKLDDNVRVILRDFPVIGSRSKLAARVALAAHLQGRYADLHYELMRAPWTDQSSMFALAARLDLDLRRLERDMNGPAVDRILRRNRKLARALCLRGTPAFVIGDEVVMGEVTLEVLQQKIASTRMGASQTLPGTTISGQPKEEENIAK